MDTVEDSLECPACQDVFTDPVTLPCGHNFCLTCIQAVWETDGSIVGPFFCPECQVFFKPDLRLQINISLQTKVKDFTATNGPLRDGVQMTSPEREPKTTTPTINCDHCIESPSVAVRTCLTCDASLCQAHAQLHQQRSVLREHTVVEVTEDPLSMKCREHRDELKLFCMEHKVPVCCLCVLVGMHKNHKAAQLHEACADYKVNMTLCVFNFKVGISDQYTSSRIFLCVQNMLEITMNQLLKRRGEAEHAMKDLGTLYTETVVKLMTHATLSKYIFIHGIVMDCV